MEKTGTRATMEENEFQWLEEKKIQSKPACHGRPEGQGKYELSVHMHQLDML